MFTSLVVASDAKKSYNYKFAKYSKNILRIGNKIIFHLIVHCKLRYEWSGDANHRRSPKKFTAQFSLHLRKKMNTV